MLLVGFYSSSFVGLRSSWVSTLPLLGYSYATRLVESKVACLAPYHLPKLGLKGSF